MSCILKNLATRPIKEYVPRMVYKIVYTIIDEG